MHTTVSVPCFVPLHRYHERAWWQDLERTSQLHPPWCDSCIYQDVARTSRRAGQGKTKKKDGLLVIPHVEDEEEEPELWAKHGHIPQRNQQHPLTKESGGNSPKGSLWTRQGDQRPCVLAKADKGKLDKHFWNGSCHLDAATSHNTKPNQQSTYYLKVIKSKKGWSTCKWQGCNKDPIPAKLLEACHIVQPLQVARMDQHWEEKKMQGPASQQ